MPARLTAHQVRDMLVLRCKELGGQSAFAAKYDVHYADVWQQIHGRRNPTKRVAAALGLRPVKLWEIEE